MEVNVHQAKTHLSKLLRRTLEGEEIIIARAGVPIARLVSIERERAPFPLGLDRGAYEVPKDFDAPLPPEVIAAFEGKALSMGTRAKRGGKGRRA
jgi:prevent-host-death family protein